jgi:hypothetical protein
MQCQHCGTGNRPAARFCRGCGVALPTTRPEAVGAVAVASASPRITNDVDEDGWKPPPSATGDHGSIAAGGQPRDELTGLASGAGAQSRSHGAVIRAPIRGTVRGLQQRQEQYGTLGGGRGNWGAALLAGPG